MMLFRRRKVFLSPKELRSQVSKTGLDDGRTSERPDDDNHHHVRNVDTGAEGAKLSQTTQTLRQKDRR